MTKIRSIQLQQLGRNIKRLRQSSGMSQEDLAIFTGLHRTFIGSVERGEHNISFMNLVKIAGVLEVDLVELFEQIEPYKTATPEPMIEEAVMASQVA